LGPLAAVFGFSATAAVVTAANGVDAARPDGLGNGLALETWGAIRTKKTDAGLGYEITDPADYDPALAAERTVDGQRSWKDCYCGESRHGQLWTDFYERLDAGLRSDPSFSGPWVHDLCAFAYPIIFKVISLDPRDDSFSLHSDCPAGALSMVSVCAQSAALQRLQNFGSKATAGTRTPETTAETPRWRRTARVVLNEGDSVGDVFQPLPLESCLALCGETPACQSIAFGPYGCHLKNRCVQPGEPMVAAGEQGDDYRTYFLEPCRQASPPTFKGGEIPILDDGDAAGGGADEDRSAAFNSQTEDMLNMMSFALRVLEFCFHCLDSSPWPFLLSEILENYALSVEATEDFVWKRASGRFLGPSTYPGPSAGRAGGGGGRALDSDSSAPSMLPPTDEAAATLGRIPVWRLTLQRLQVRWTRGLEMEAEFWRKKLSPDPQENDRFERLETWMDSGEVTWFLDGDDPCKWLTSSRDAQTVDKGANRNKRRKTAPPPRVLNVGSGPFAPGPIKCQLPEKNDQTSVVPVIAADGLARYYLRILDEYSLQPPYSPLQCPVEELHLCFPPAHFDVVHMRNALDHVFDPLLGIQRMLHVVRPGGWVLLRHARNEGIAGSFRNGLHQWAFDTIECPDSQAIDASGACHSSFLLWNPELRLDVTSELLSTGLAQEVRTRLVDHPADDAPEDEKYVWVEIRRPTVLETSQTLR